ncbi:hypothetical protein [Maribellus sediminis]|uniref:hypothetical protein n=1 Tax=Maribellus sediminis TaxID=2696285 RepID=UPI00142FD350|nr:hypothetical protein [Maribellus sediminis]
MKEFSLISVSIITILLTIQYINLLIKQQTKPALAMWIMFSVAVGMSMVTYLAEGEFGFLDNIQNTVDLFYVAAITTSILIFGDKKSKISRFDLGCLGAVFLIVVFWIFTQNHLVTNFLIQSILVIAYFPVIQRMIKTRENSESFIIWLGMLIAPALSLISSKGLLATVYSVRAICCIGLLLIFMAWIEISARKQIQLNK